MENQKSKCGILSLKGQYTAFFSTTRNRFWRAAPNGSPVICDRTWVQLHELFTVIDDPESGATMIQSDASKRYLVVRPSDKKITATQDRAVQEARFKIDAFGGVKAYNGLYVETAGNGELTATSSVRVDFVAFDVRTIAISNVENQMYAAAGSINGKNAIVFGKGTPYQFFLLNDGTNSYLETSNYEFVHPENSVDPITYTLTDIQQKNFRLSLEPIAEKADVYGIKSNFNNLYLTIETSSLGTFLRCNAEDCKGTNAQFKISLIR